LYWVTSSRVSALQSASVEPPTPRCSTSGCALKSCARCGHRRIVELPTNSTPPLAGRCAWSALAKAPRLPFQRACAGETVGVSAVGMMNSGNSCACSAGAAAASSAASTNKGVNRCVV